MTTRIEDVLAPRDPSLTDENEWEEFVLSDVKVRLPGKARYANLLLASPDSPVAVTGQLERVEESQEHLILDQRYRSKRVILDNVTHYAYGQLDDGELNIWVAGHAGWFSISPSRGYKPMFGEIVEAVDLLYFLADKHQNKGRKGNRWQPKVEFLFQEYTKHTNGACEDPEDSAEVFYKHHAFLIAQMVRGKEGVDWPGTPLYNHFQEKYPDEFERAEATVRASSVDESEESMDDAMDSTDEEMAQAETIFGVIIDIKDSGALSRRRLNIRNLAETLLSRYEMSSLESAVDLIVARAEHIIRLMDENEQESTYYWSRKLIYEELRAAMNVEGAGEVGTTPLHPRQPEKQETPSEEEESEDEVPIQKGRRRKARKSLLRPKISSVSAKGTGKRNKHLQLEMTDSEVEEEEEDEMDMDMDMEEYLSNDDSPSKNRRGQAVRNKLASRVNETIRSVMSHSGSPSLDHIVLPEAEIEPRMNGEPSAAHSDTSADIPLDTWVCPALGCGKMIPKASSKRAKEAIMDHSLAHADDTQTKLNLILAEQRLNVNVSVSNLISRIQGAGAMNGISQDTAALHEELRNFPG